VAGPLGDAASFPNSMAEPGTLPDAAPRRFASLVAFDPPRHTRMRNLVTRAFTAPAVAHLEAGARRSPTS
jgi:cytochrome P450